MDDPCDSVICTICLEAVDGLSRPTATLTCKHTYHLDCIGSAFNAKGEMECPNCRCKQEGEWRLPSAEQSEPYFDPLNFVLDIHFSRDFDGFDPNQDLNQPDDNESLDDFEFEHATTILAPIDTEPGSEPDNDDYFSFIRRYQHILNPISGTRSSLMSGNEIYHDHENADEISLESHEGQQNINYFLDGQITEGSRLNANTRGPYVTEQERLQVMENTGYNINTEQYHYLGFLGPLHPTNHRHGHLQNELPVRYPAHAIFNGTVPAPPAYNTFAATPNIPSLPGQPEPEEAEYGSLGIRGSSGDEYFIATELGNPRPRRGLVALLETEYGSRLPHSVSRVSHDSERPTDEQRYGAYQPTAEEPVHPSLFAPFPNYVTHDSVGVSNLSSNTFSPQTGPSFISGRMGEQQNRIIHTPQENISLIFNEPTQETSDSTIPTEFNSQTSPSHLCENRLPSEYRPQRYTSDAPSRMRHEPDSSEGAGYNGGPSRRLRVFTNLSFEDVAESQVRHTSSVQINHDTTDIDEFPSSEEFTNSIEDMSENFDSSQYDPPTRQVACVRTVYPPSRNISSRVMVLSEQVPEQSIRGQMQHEGIQPRHNRRASVGDNDAETGESRIIIETANITHTTHVPPRSTGQRNRSRRGLSEYIQDQAIEIQGQGTTQSYTSLSDGLDKIPTRDRDHFTRQEREQSPKPISQPINQQGRWANSIDSNPNPLHDIRHTEPNFELTNESMNGNDPSGTIEENIDENTHFFSLSNRVLHMREVIPDMEDSKPRQELQIGDDSRTSISLKSTKPRKQKHRNSRTILAQDEGEGDAYKETDYEQKENIENMTKKSIERNQSSYGGKRNKRASRNRKMPAQSSEVFDEEIEEGINAEPTISANVYSGEQRRENTRMTRSHHALSSHRSSPNHEMQSMKTSYMTSNTNIGQNLRESATGIKNSTREYESNPRSFESLRQVFSSEEENDQISFERHIQISSDCDSRMLSEVSNRNRRKQNKQKHMEHISSYPNEESSPSSVSRVEGRTESRLQRKKSTYPKKHIISPIKTNKTADLRGQDAASPANSNEFFGSGGDSDELHADENFCIEDEDNTNPDRELSDAINGYLNFLKGDGSVAPSRTSSQKSKTLYRLDENESEEYGAPSYDNDEVEIVRMLQQMGIGPPYPYLGQERKGPRSKSEENELRKSQKTKRRSKASQLSTQMSPDDELDGGHGRIIDEHTEEVQHEVMASSSRLERNQLHYLESNDRHRDRKDKKKGARNTNISKSPKNTRSERNSMLHEHWDVQPVTDSSRYLQNDELDFGHGSFQEAESRIASNVIEKEASRNSKIPKSGVKSSLKCAAQLDFDSAVDQASEDTQSPGTNYRHSESISGSGFKKTRENSSLRQQPSHRSLLHALQREQELEDELAMRITQLGETFRKVYSKYESVSEHNSPPQSALDVHTSTNPRQVASTGTRPRQSPSHQNYGSLSEIPNAPSGAVKKVLRSSRKSGHAHEEPNILPTERPKTEPSSRLSTESRDMQSSSTYMNPDADEADSNPSYSSQASPAMAYRHIPLIVDRKHQIHPNLARTPIEGRYKTNHRFRVGDDE